MNDVTWRLEEMIERRDRRDLLPLRLPEVDEYLVRDGLWPALYIEDGGQG